RRSVHRPAGPRELEDERCPRAAGTGRSRPVDSTPPQRNYETAQLWSTGADDKGVSNQAIVESADPVAPASAEPIERFELLDLIGRGGVADVYRARERSGTFVREVCVKRLVAAVAEEQATFLREEARVLAGVRHANVVSLLGAGEDSD